MCFADADRKRTMWDRTWQECELEFLQENKKAEVQQAEMKQKSKIITNSIYEKSINYCREKEYIKSIK